MLKIIFFILATLVYLLNPSAARAVNDNPRLGCGGNEAGFVDTAIGCLPVNDTGAFTGFILSWGLGVGGGIALMLIAYAGIKITTAGGDLQKVQAGKELMTAAIAGLVFVIFSVFILRVVGINILGIPEL